MFAIFADLDKEIRQFLFYKYIFGKRKVCGIIKGCCWIPFRLFLKNVKLKNQLTYTKQTIMLRENLLTLPDLNNLTFK